MARASGTTVTASGEVKNIEVGRGSAGVDDASREMIFQGCNIAQLEVIFRSDYRTIRKKIFENNIKPSGRRNGSDIYLIADIAPFIVKPFQDIEQAILKMSHKDLPKDLTKEFWAGQRSRQDFEEKAGVLWRTEKVIEEVSEVFKIIKMSTLLMLDGVERNTELTERQRSIIKGLTHGMLEETAKRIEERFKMPENKYGEYSETESEEEL